MYQHQQNHNKILLSTICYSDIFDYPLNKEGIEKFVIGNKLSKLSIEKTLSLLLKENKIYYKDGYYCLKKREKIIETFIKNKKINEKKIKKAKKLISILKYIPTIALIGLSGSLALESAKKSDDIDLFIISKKNTLWTTRFLVVLFLQILGVRRRKESLHAEDKICVNMFLDESNLLLPVKKQNLYTAHEVVQMKPFYEKNNMYQKFLSKNIWVKKYLPQSVKIKMKKDKKNKQSIIFNKFILPFELLLKLLQKVYMKKSQTSEIITPTLLAFHPNDQQEIVLRKFQERVKKYAI